MSKRRLGKGIDALIQSQDQEAPPQVEGITEVAVSALKPNPNQPRKHFDETALGELADSIREKGVLQPILVEPADDGSYVIIAGERRYRAALKAGIERVPVIPRTFTPAEKLEIALIENLQREDLNPIEEARAYQSLMETANATQDELARRLGKNRSTVANSLRLLRLPVAIQEAVAEGRLSPGHARAVLAVESEERRSALAQAMLSQEVSVRVAERAAALVNTGAEAAKALREALLGGADVDGSAGREGGTGGAQGAGSRSGSGGGSGAGSRDPDLAAVEQNLLEWLGTRVNVRGSAERGKIEIEYLSTEDLNRIVEIIRGGEKDFEL